MIARLYDANGKVISQTLAVLTPAKDGELPIWRSTFGPFDEVTTGVACGYEIEGFGEVHRETFEHPVSALKMGTITVEQGIAIT